MKLYTHNQQQMKFQRLKLFPILLIECVFTAIVAMLACNYGWNRGHEAAIASYNDCETAHVVVDNVTPDFSQEALIDMLKELKVNHPHIVLAQSMLETGNYQSDIFRQNHNLFGMKVARRRVCTALGSNLGHAYYENWVESVYDYAFYQSAYLRDLTNEDRYFKYLSANYAQDPNYVKKLKRIIRKNDLKQLFED